LYDLLDSSNEEEDKQDRKYRIMTNRNRTREFCADQSMTDKHCNKLIQEAFEEKKSKAQSRSLSDSDDDKENTMPNQPLCKKRTASSSRNQSNKKIKITIKSRF
jgi:hypothetical protein